MAIEQEYVIFLSTILDAAKFEKEEEMAIVSVESFYKRGLTISDVRNFLEKVMREGAVIKEHISYQRKEITPSLEMDFRREGDSEDLDDIAVYHFRLMGGLENFRRYIKGYEREIASSDSIPIFNLPSDTKWEQVTIKFKNRDDVEVLLNEKHFIDSTSETMGFIRSQTKDKVNDKQWELLHLLAGIYAVAKQNKMDQVPATIEELALASEVKNDAIATTKKKLSQQLQSVFGIKEDPFDDYRHCGYYRTRFGLIPESDLRQADIFQTGRPFRDGEFSDGRELDKDEEDSQYESVNYE